MAEPFAGYYKEVVTTVEKITHRIRVKVGSSAGELRSLLENVPPYATINEVIGDQDHEDFEYCGEIVFDEERNLG